MSVHRRRRRARHEDRLRRQLRRRARGIEIAEHPEHAGLGKCDRQLEDAVGDKRRVRVSEELQILAHHEGVKQLFVNDVVVADGAVLPRVVNQELQRGRFAGSRRARQRHRDRDGTRRDRECRRRDSSRSAGTCRGCASARRDPSDTRRPDPWMGRVARLIESGWRQRRIGGSRLIGPRGRAHGADADEPEDGREAHDERVLFIRSAMARASSRRRALLWPRRLVAAHNIGATPVTWNREISRLVYDKCASCHRPGGTAFSMMTYPDVQPRLVEIKTAVLSRPDAALGRDQRLWRIPQRSGAHAGADRTDRGLDSERRAARQQSAGAARGAEVHGPSAISVAGSRDAVQRHRDARRSRSCWTA